ncbi:MAG TPA: pyridoxal-dependent decarboxylase, partial [Gemmatimonadaceae bacterium]
MTTDLAPVTPSARSTSAPPAAPSTTPSSSHWQMIVDEVARFPEDVRALPVAPPTDGLALREELAERYRFDVPVSLDLLTADVMQLLRAHTVHVTHPRYFGLFNPSVREAGVVADTLAALYNPQLAAWSHAPAAVELERLALHHRARRLGLDPDAGAATFTTGGAEGNLTAVLAALAAHFPEAARLG